MNKKHLPKMGKSQMLQKLIDGHLLQQDLKMVETISERELKLMKEIEELCKFNQRTLPSFFFHNYQILHKDLEWLINFIYTHFPPKTPEGKKNNLRCPRCFVSGKLKLSDLLTLTDSKKGDVFCDACHGWSSCRWVLSENMGE